MSTDLLLQITRCPIAARCLDGQSLPCSTIVRSQGVTPTQQFHVPEPWSGHIATAPILFVSSNPSIDLAEAYPVQDWADARRIEFFDGRFDQRANPWIDDRMRPLLDTSPPRHRDRGTRFWSAARQRASELLEGEARPGHDFALTEVVHCKSATEHGVAEAYRTCRRIYLRPVMAASAALVVVLFGSYAKNAFRETFGIPPGVPLTGPCAVAGRQRVVLQLPHPNARQPRANCAPLTSAQLAQVRQYLRVHRPSRSRSAQEI